MRNILDNSYERAELIKTVASAGTPERITARTIATMQRYAVTNKILVTTTEAHGYVNGGRVYITGATEPEFNNTTSGWLYTVLSPTTFIFFAPGTTSAATGSPLTCYADLHVRQATVVGMKSAQGNNTGGVRLGVGSANGAQSYPIVAGQEIYLNSGMPDGSRVNLGSYFVDAETDGDGVVVLYS